MTDALLSFWGKARPAEDGPRFHPLLWHCLDVAAVCEALLARDPGPVRALAALTGAAEDDARRLVIRLAALHDIGKVALGFQAKVPALVPAAFRPLPARLPPGDHTALGLHLLLGPLAPECRALAPDFWTEDWSLLLPAVAGHHGRPTGEAQVTPDEIGVAGVAAARALLRAVTDALPGPPLSGAPAETDPPGPLAVFTWRLAGLMTLADWIGSSRSFFPYAAAEGDACTYLDAIARPRAARAIARAGLTPASPAPDGGLAALTGAPFAPSPLQAIAESRPLPETGPVLLLVEDTTGAGKTEAALILAHRLMRDGRANGLYCALPTMATANALWARLGACYRRLFAAGARPSLVLAHGGRAFHPGFRASVLDLGPDETAFGPEDADLTASAACARWIADDSRRSLLADVGAGTVDQAILSVLPVKFAPLRQTGLAGKVLVLDEIHSFDSYVTEELARLVEFQAAAGGSVIALSATLSAATRTLLLRAFHRGLGRAPGRISPAGRTSAYPALTVAGADGAVSGVPVPPRPDLARRVRIRRLADAAAARATVLAAARAGAAVAWIRNTVDDVIDARATLAEAGATLFHARFAPVDRQRIEAGVMARFGRAGTPEDRRGRILVASQVIEQSLDLDFDLIVTDLAPVDLLIQRAGRLWRHQRGPRPPLAPGAAPAEEPAMCVVSPEPVTDAAEDWYRAAFGRAGAVYRDHAALWRTAEVLFQTGCIRSPEGVRPLVEAVYGPDALDHVPDALKRSRDRAFGERKAEAGVARDVLLKLEDGYTAGRIWNSDTRPPTRLSEARTLLRLARITGPEAAPRLAPFADMTPDPDEPPEWTARRAWALSEIAVRTARVSGRGPMAPAIEAAAAEIEAGWRRVGDFAVILPLVPDGSGWQGTVRGRGGGTVPVRYDAETGLQFGE